MGMSWTAPNPVVAGTTQGLASQMNEAKTNIQTIYTTLSLDYGGGCGADWDVMAVGLSSSSFVLAAQINELMDRTDYAHTWWCTTHHATYHDGYLNGDHDSYDGTDRVGYHGTHYDGYHSGHYSGHENGHNSDEKGTYHNTHYISHHPGYHFGHYDTNYDTNNGTHHTSQEYNYDSTHLNGYRDGFNSPVTNQ